MIFYKTFFKKYLNFLRNVRLVDNITNFTKILQILQKKQYSINLGLNKIILRRKLGKRIVIISTYTQTIQPLFSSISWPKAKINGTNDIGMIFQKGILILL